MNLSIIIPVYNTEKYISDAIDSCIHQNDIDNFQYEIIVVDDGSTDNSILLAESKLKNSNISYKIIRQNNSGLSVARNTGLNASQGDYIWFVDSDDWITNDALKNIKDVVLLSKYDYIAFGVQVFIEGVGYGSIQYPNNSYGLMLAQSHLYKKDFLLNNKLSFFPNVFHEDFEFTPRASFFATQRLIIQQPFYIYRKREQSITTSVNPKKAFDMVVIINRLYTFQVQHQDEGCDFMEYIALGINNALTNTYIHKMNKENEKLLNKQLYKSKHLFAALKNSNKLAYRIEYYMFMLFPKNCVQVYKKLQSFNLKHNSYND